MNKVIKLSKQPHNSESVKVVIGELKAHSVVQELHEENGSHGDRDQIR